MPTYTQHDFASLNATDTLTTENLKDVYINGTEFTNFAAVRERAKAKVQRIREALYREALEREVRERVALYRDALKREAELKDKDAEQAKRIAGITAIRNAKGYDI